MKQNISFNLNGEDLSLYLDPSQTLLDVIRDELGLTGAKKGCDEGDCGACTVLIDGKPTNSCLTLIGKVEGRKVLTIEGLGEPDNLHILQEAFLKVGAVQCGFCTPGMLLSAKAILDENLNPSEDEIRFAIAGNLCRCTGYTKIVQAIQHASTMLDGRR